MKYGEDEYTAEEAIGMKFDETWEGAEWDSFTHLSMWCVYVYVCACMGICVHVYMYACMCICICMHLCKCV